MFSRTQQLSRRAARTNALVSGDNTNGSPRNTTTNSLSDTTATWTSYWFLLSFTSSPLPRRDIDVSSVWSVLRRQHDFYRGHGGQSQSRPQRHHACPPHPARPNRTRRLHGSGVY